MRARRDWSRRSGGFTLLEVMLALGLIVIIMSAVYGFYDFALQSRGIGHRRVHRAELARTLLEQIAHDLRGIAPNTIKYAPALRGNSEILDCLTAAVPDPQLFADRQITRRGSPREMDLRRIMWFLAVNEEEYDENNEPLVVGVVRRTQRNLDPFEQFGSQELVDEEKRNFHDQLITTEIKYLEFSYFDGTKWVQNWQMGEEESKNLIPIAIRVTVGFQPMAVEELEQRRQEDVDPMAEHPRQYRGRFSTIVRLPAADVMLGTMSRLRNRMTDEFGLGG